MKILIVSDMHANLPSLQAVLNTDGDFDKLIFLGDAIDYGPHPKECVNFIRENANYYEKIFGIIKDIQAVNRKLFSALSLTPQISYESRVVQSQAVYLWRIFIDSTANNLLRYGDLTHEQSELVDGYVQRLLSLIDKLKEFS